MKDRKLAARYARALVAALADESAAAAADRFLTAVAQAMDESVELRDALVNPAVSRSQRKAVLRSLAEGREVPARLLAFLDVVADNGRLGAFPAIAAVFHEERERAAGIVPATVTTASPMSAELQVRLRSVLERLSSRRVRLTVNVDPSLVGGAITQIGSMVYDGSVRTHLNRLRHRMAEE